MSDSRCRLAIEAYRMAHQLRSEGLPPPFIANELNLAGLRPLTAASVPLVQRARFAQVGGVSRSRSTPRGIALYLGLEGLRLRETGQRLAPAGHLPKRGGQWYPRTVMLADGELGGDSGGLVVLAFLRRSMDADRRALERGANLLTRPRQASSSVKFSFDTWNRQRLRIECRRGELRPASVGA